MFETTFSYASATPIPTNFSTSAAVKFLHDFETVIRLSPDCRGCKPIKPPNSKNGYTNGNTNKAQMQYYEVEDDLPFIPKRLWSGGVKYTADFLPVDDGCDITVHAPGGFTSTNHWRILRESAPLNEEIRPGDANREELPSQLERTATRDIDNVNTGTAGWYVQIISDAKCPRAFAGFVKGFLQNSHSQLQHAFIEYLKQVPPEEAQEGVQGRTRRPTLGRRRSTAY